MIKSEGRCFIDAISAGEVTINSLGAGVVVTAKMAYVNSGTGERMGWTNRSLWSESTLKKAEELLRALEAETLATVFEKSEDPTTDGSESANPTTIDGVPGL